MDKFEKCKNCRYYLEHYVKGLNYYHAIGGHCINKPLNENKRRNRYELVEHCEYWESDEIKKLERKENIINTLRHMETHLSDIVQLLKDDIK